jgi:hypothetical protein
VPLLAIQAGKLLAPRLLKALQRALLLAEKRSLKMRSMGLIRGSVCLLLGSLAVACGSGREVEVTGEVAAPASLTLSGPIRVEFIDIVDETDPAQNEVVHDVELAAPGSFAEKVSLEGDKLMVRAINDSNGDGACSAGEAWAQTEAEIAEDDTIQPLTITLGTAACP